jgi:8-oxo-dGTP diphosphatase
MTQVLGGGQEADVSQLPRVTRVGAYALCLDEGGRILLCRIAKTDPDAGMWTLPGGGVEFGEVPAHAAIRELDEEAGLTGRVESLAGVDSASFTVPGPDGPVAFHAIRIVYRVRVTSGELRHEVAGTTDTCRWLEREEAAMLPLIDPAVFGLGLAFGELA